MSFAIAGGEIIWPFPEGEGPEIVHGGLEFWSIQPTYSMTGRIDSVSTIVGTLLINITELILLTSSITKIIEKDSEYV